MAETDTTSFLDAGDLPPRGRTQQRDNQQAFNHGIVYVTTMWIEVPVSVPPMTGLILLPEVSDAFDTVQVDEYAPLEPHVSAPEQIVVPVPVEPNVGVTVVVLELTSERHWTAVMVSVTPSVFRHD